jgi:hypothetical protein
MSPLIQFFFSSFGERKEVSFMMAGGLCALRKHRRFLSTFPPPGLLIPSDPTLSSAGSMEAVIAGKRNAGQNEGIYH